MLDITLIREKPEWVKQQILKLNDPAAAARVDAILALDQQRRALLAESEAVQAGRNKLNKAIGRLRGDKQIDEATRATRAAETRQADRSGRLRRRGGDARQRSAGHAGREPRSAGDDVRLDEHGRRARRARRREATSRSGRSKPT